MQVIHCQDALLLLVVNGNLDIVDVARVRHGDQPPAGVTTVRRLLATPCGKPSIDKDYFTTDGLGCVRLLYWIIMRYPNAQRIGIRNRFEALFASNPNDALTAVKRIMNGADETAPGECSYFCNEQWRHHPVEMMAIAVVGKLHRRDLFDPSAIDSNNE